VVRQNKTIKDIERGCRDLDKVFGPMLIKDIKPAMVEKYQHQRLREPTRYGNHRSPANVNRTIAVLKRMFNLGVREELADKNPCWKIKMLPATCSPKTDLLLYTRTHFQAVWFSEFCIIHF